jgi:hypothetical protein
MFRLLRSIFKVEKKLSMAALSQQLPLRLMLQVTPCVSMTNILDGNSACGGQVS